MVESSEGGGEMSEVVSALGVYRYFTSVTYTRSFASFPSSLPSRNPSLATIASTLPGLSHQFLLFKLLYHIFSKMSMVLTSCRIQHGVTSSGRMYSSRPEAQVHPSCRSGVMGV
jgi:hypothetical protein